MKIKQTPSFERQLKKLAKKNYPISLLKLCLEAVVEQDSRTLKRIKDHALKGKWSSYREFHPTRYGNYGKTYDNWIVIYYLDHLDHDELILVLVATGTHEILDQ